MRLRRFLGHGLGAAALLILANCDDALESSIAPQARPSQPQLANAYVEPSAASRDLARYYQRVERDLLTRGLMRTDGGGPDTPFDADDLARNFEAIAFYSEYLGAAVSGSSQRTSGRLSRWSGPVRIQAEFGPSVSPDQRAADKEQIRAYSERMSSLTGHPISTATRNANFHVFVAGDDDTEFVQTRLRQLFPSIGQAQLNLFQDLPRSFYCFVFASASNGAPNTYTGAVALVRAEHPDLMRLSCIHEEIAQGLGLPNDSPRARPSIFNDDDEFALLTSHDEKLLTMLYDPRLKPGMTAQEAAPVVRIIARELMGQSL
ncbi:DUF2927 domain-containing protein [Ruegeria arenilitoris]|uniref:DUF2927 domain-containing protein n=1 Tax=Ruegeria arenilitoris TaxID=1173585 RepID=UPI001480BD79